MPPFLGKQHAVRRLLPRLRERCRVSAAERLGPLAGRWDWIYYKSWLSLASGLSDDVLHLFAGLPLLVLASLILRRPPWHWTCWLAVALPELANEIYDVTQTSYVTDEGNVVAAWHDFWMTLLWPTAILLTFGFLARRAERTGTQPGEKTPTDVSADR